MSFLANAVFPVHLNACAYCYLFASLPISYEDAIPILKQLHGKGIPAEDLGKEWIGGLGYYGVEYYTGPSEIDIHFVNEMNTVSLSHKCMTNLF